MTKVSVSVKSARYRNAMFLCLTLSLIVVAWIAPAATSPPHRKVWSRINSQLSVCRFQSFCNRVVLANTTGARHITRFVAIVQEDPVKAHA